MNVLALEMSSARVSLALRRAGRCVERVEWAAQRKGESPLFDHLLAVLNAGGLRWEDVDVFSAGRGPGNYSGLRVAVTVAQALALPGGGRLFFLNSGAPVAAEIFRRFAFDRVAVAGDARRGMVWYGLFERARVESGDCACAWRLVPWGAFDEEVALDIPRVSSAWRALTGLEAASGLHWDAWVQEDVYPDAGVLAECVEHMVESGRDSEAAVPVYMHPAVA